MGRELCKEEIYRDSNRYICEFKTPEMCTLKSSSGMCKVFWWHFERCITKESGLCGDEFCSLLPDFPQLELNEVASCEGEIHRGRSSLGIEDGQQWLVSGI